MKNPSRVGLNRRGLYEILFQVWRLALCWQKETGCFIAWHPKSLRNEEASLKSLLCLALLVLFYPACAIGEIQEKDWEGEWGETPKNTTITLSATAAVRASQVGDMIWLVPGPDEGVTPEVKAQRIQENIDALKADGYELIESPQVEGDSWKFIFKGKP